MREYAERRAELGCGRTGFPSKRRRPLSLLPLQDNEHQDNLESELARADADVSSTRVMTFGSGISWPEIWYVRSPR